MATLRLDPQDIEAIASAVAERMKAFLSAGAAIQAPRRSGNEELLDAYGIAKLFGVRLSTVRTWTRRALLPHVRLGRVARYDPREVGAWLESRRTKRGDPAAVARKFLSGAPPATGEMTPGNRPETPHMKTGLSGEIERD